MSEEITQEVEVKTEKKPSKLSPKKIFIGCGIIILTATGIYGYYKYHKVFPSTDNAYVDADIVNISAKVGGYIDKVFVKNNQYVHKGDKLVQIDPTDYQLKVTKAGTNIIKAKGQLAIANEKVKAARADLTKAKASVKTAVSMSDRYTELFHEDAGSLQDAQKYLNQRIQAEKASDQALSMLKQALIQVDVSKANLKATKLGFDNANLNLGYTTVTAPSDGYVSNLKIYKGQLISPAQSLFGFVNNEEWWINANFKETDLDRIKEGQKVEVSLDMYNHKYEGEVNSISYATGSVFSLLPPENATGNWVKVTQRFPVKITLKDSKEFPLRVGASAEVQVDTLGG